jgi:hypothetical protein
MVKWLKYTNKNGDQIYSVRSENFNLGTLINRMIANNLEFCYDYSQNLEVHLLKNRQGIECYPIPQTKLHYPSTALNDDLECSYEGK